MARAVLEIAGREHHGVATQRAQPVQHRAGRQTGEKLDRRPVLEPRDLAAQLGFQGAILRGGPRHHHQPPGSRMPAQRQGDGAREIVLDRDADHIGGQRRKRRQERPGHGRVDHWNLRKQLGAMAQQKTERLFTPDDQHGRRPQGILLVQEQGQGANVGLAVEAGIVEKLGAQLRRIGERLAQAGFNFEIRRQQALVGI